MLNSLRIRIHPCCAKTDALVGIGPDQDWHFDEFLLFDAPDRPLSNELSINDGEPFTAYVHGGVDFVVGDCAETLKGVCCVVAAVGWLVLVLARARESWECYEPCSGSDLVIERLVPAGIIVWGAHSSTGFENGYVAYIPSAWEESCNMCSIPARNSPSSLPP